MHWTKAVAKLRQERRPGVLVTVTDVRGHAPREPGAKMVVALPVVEEGAPAPASTPTEERAQRASRREPDIWGSVGGGNLEETAISRAQAMIESAVTAPESLTMSLNDRARTEHGRQCCGGEVTLLLEPLAVVPAVAVFGMGHVGLELARILCRHDLELHLVDSRTDQVAPARLSCLDDGVATVHAHHSPVPELVLGTVPAGTHVLVMTHDHAEDFALCDAALRCAHLGTIGLIGSSAKWARFRQGLLVEGHTQAVIDRIQSPIGLPDVSGKEPATIAVGVAADLIRAFSAEEARR